jgi:hypothetical protein
LFNAKRGPKPVDQELRLINLDYQTIETKNFILTRRW